MRLSFTSLQPDCRIKTSSSRTDSEILTLISPLENFLTVQGTRGTLSLGFQGIKTPVQRLNGFAETAKVAHRSATAWASSGWLFPGKKKSQE